jgi:PAS domain S-box-containing protein
MKDDRKNKKELIEELEKSKQKIIALERTLKPGESQIKIVIENMRDVIGINDLNGIFQFVTPSIKEVLGYEIDDIIGRSSLDFIHPEDLGRIKEALNRIVDKGQAEETYRFRHADGHFVFLESSGRAIKTWNRVTGFVISSRDITERMRAEEALKKSEHRFRDLAELLPEAVYETDDRLNFTYGNHKAFELFGYSPEDLKAGLNAFSMIAPEDRPRVMENFSRRLQGEELGLLEYKGMRKDGSLFPILLHNVPIQKEGKFVGARGIVIDITERKQMEEALRESEEKLQMALSGAEMGMWNLDLATMTGTIDDRSARILGYRREDIPAERSSWDEMTHPDDVPRVHESLNAHIEGHVPVFQSEHRMRTATGAWKWVYGRGKIIKRQEDGSPVLISGTLHDIDERKIMEKAFQESEDLYRTAMEGSNDGVVIIQDDRYVYFNQKFLDTLGRSRDEMMGQPAGTYIHPDDEAVGMDHFHKFKQGLTISPHIETKVLKPDGSVAHFEVSLVDVTYKGRQAVMAYLRDITDRKRAEAEEMKRHKLESVGTLAAGIAHDFNNLLAVIHGYLDLLAIDIPPGDKVHNRLMAAKNAVVQATELTNRLIIFAKGGEPVKEVIDIGDTIKKEVLGSIGISPVEKRFYLAPDLWPVEVDQKQIQQVIKNLTRNAVEAMPEGGRLTVRAENITVRIQDRLPIREGTYVRISIEDTGTGIPANELPNIFDPYYSTKQRGAKKGMGLGLSVCHSVVGKHKGCITIESQDGKGCTFRVYLPAIIREALQIDEQLQDKIPDSKRRILVMDDEALVRDMLRELLTALGFEVETANDGLEAIDLYIKAAESERPYDMVLFDLMVIKGLGGEQTMARLLATHPGVKGIICSGYTDDPVIQHYDQYGFVGALRKPFTLEALRSILEKHL